MLEEFINYGNIALEEKIGIIKICVIFICTYLTNFKLINRKIEFKFVQIIKVIFVIFYSIFCALLRYQIDYLTTLICWILIITLIFERNNIKQSLLVTITSLSINYILSLVSVIIGFVFNLIIKIDNNYINLFIILSIYVILINLLFKVKRLKYGIISLKNKSFNEYTDMLILIISAMVLTTFVILVNSNLNIGRNLMLGIIVISIIMFVIIQKSLQLYYKQQMLIKDLNETREELEKKKKEIAELEAENIEISKKRHTIVHKQKSLEHKLEEIITKTEISSEEVAEVRERIKKLNNEIYDKEKVTELDKTGITNIDDMLKYMQDECIKNQISFTLKLTGNIHYMINNFISKDDLETLLADHIKDAIIAINHTDNINRSILVRLGEINRMYGLYIYDSGIEFKKEVLENLGNKPFTTYKNEGGTGMGFMNTFDTLRKYNASLSIEEFNEPIIDNYTKVIAIKFDKKKEVKIKSYQGIDINKFI